MHLVAPGDGVHGKMTKGLVEAQQRLRIRLPGGALAGGHAAGGIVEKPGGFYIGSLDGKIIYPHAGAGKQEIGEVIPAAEGTDESPALVLVLCLAGGKI